MPRSCCSTSKGTCKRKDSKTFKMPRKFSRKKCRNPRGFTMRASCAPYRFCKKKKKNKTIKKKKK